ncbi:hypothetical protein [Aphanothece sacrum]|uniref:hypothetical protein n=1 Tax=Aphanothece sacrum TaxID=1122 RepID=UPI000F6075F5|nr:hypothetical protein [Aphanothece sacrum]
MKNPSKHLISLIGISLLTGSSLLLTELKANSQKACTAFPVIGAKGTEVTKTVSQPGIPGPFGLRINNNWNTDFAVVPLKKYKRYIVNFKAHDSAEYRIRAFLKYNDNTSDNFHDKQLGFSSGQTLEIVGSPRTDTIPFQVNVFVGEPISLGRTYTISVQGCM